MNGGAGSRYWWTFGQHGVALASSCFPYLTSWPRSILLKVAFGRLNVDDNQGIAMRYDVYAIPTFIIFMNGKTVDRAVGAVGEKGLEGLLQSYQ